MTFDTRVPLAGILGVLDDQDALDRGSAALSTLEARRSSSRLLLDRAAAPKVLRSPAGPRLTGAGEQTCVPTWSRSAFEFSVVQISARSALMTLWSVTVTGSRSEEQ